MHLFTSCDALSDQRRHLLKEVGHTNWEALMKNDYGAAAQWALCFFPVDMFEGIAEASKENRFSQFIRRKGDELYSTMQSWRGEPLDRDST